MSFYFFLLLAICFTSMVISMSGMPVRTRNRALLWSVGLLLLFFAMFRGGNGRSGLLCIFKIPGNAERTWLLGDDYGRYITF